MRIYNYDEIDWRITNDLVIGPVDLPGSIAVYTRSMLIENMGALLGTACIKKVGKRI